VHVLKTAANKCAQHVTACHLSPSPADEAVAAAAAAGAVGVVNEESV